MFPGQATGAILPWPVNALQTPAPAMIACIPAENTWSVGPEPILCSCAIVVKQSRIGSGLTLSIGHTLLETQCRQCYGSCIIPCMTHKQAHITPLSMRNILQLRTCLYSIGCHISLGWDSFWCVNHQMQTLSVVLGYTASCQGTCVVVIKW